MAVKGSRQNRKNVEFSTLGLDPPLAKCGKIQKKCFAFLNELCDLLQLFFYFDGLPNKKHPLVVED